MKVKPKVVSTQVSTDSTQVSTPADSTQATEEVELEVDLPDSTQVSTDSTQATEEVESTDRQLKLLAEQIGLLSKSVAEVIVQIVDDIAILNSKVDLLISKVDLLAAQVSTQVSTDSTQVSTQATEEVELPDSTQVSTPADSTQATKVESISTSYFTAQAPFIPTAVVSAKPGSDIWLSLRTVQQFFGSIAGLHRFCMFRIDLVFEARYEHLFVCLARICCTINHIPTLE